MRCAPQVAHMQRAGANRYSKDKKIGQGSFGTVFLGTAKANGERVVVKEVDLRGLSGKDLKLSLAEVDVLKRLDHANIVAYRDSFKDADVRLNIVMEYAAGGDLGSLINKRSKAGKRFAEPEKSALEKMYCTASA